MIFWIIVLVGGIYTLFSGYPIRGIIIIVFAILFISITKYDIKEEKRKEELKQTLQKKYDKLKTIYEKTKEYYKNHKTYTNDGKGNSFIIENNELCKLEELEDLDYYIKYNYSMPQSFDIKLGLDNIKYYQLEGSKHEKQIISGGGGGGSSIGGAIAGGIIAGGIGAIIGSRKKVDEIETKYEKVDDRMTTITLKDNKQIEYGPYLYELLLDYMPEKEYDNYISNKKGK